MVPVGDVRFHSGQLWTPWLEGDEEVNVEKLINDLEVDEGCKFEIYNDHLGYPTFGIGHLITENDPEHGQPLGTPIDVDRVREAFEKDVDRVRMDCLKLYPNFTSLPDDAQLIIANMMFNMGLPRLSQFKKMKAAIDAGDWDEAANQMEDSRWYRQVQNRAERLIERMRLLAVPV
jgi:lysozyme